MTGFSIQEVRAIGEGMPDAIVRFERGFSILTGPSDTGKSFVANAINHVFGASKPLREISEQGNYARILVEIALFETGRIYSLERAWAGGDILLHESTSKDVVENLPSRTLKAAGDQTSDSVSGFLLSLCDLRNKSLRKNANGSKDNLSFRNLISYSLVQEDRIITENSPALSGQWGDKTKEESLFKLLLTGQDDSAINTAPDLKTRRGLQTGRQEVLDSLIENTRERLANNIQTSDELKHNLEDIESSLVKTTSLILSISEEIQEHEQTRHKLWESRQQKEARREQVRELIKRFALLREHYDADIARLQSTRESGRLLADLLEGVCPLCGAEPENHHHEGVLKTEELSRLTDACEAEEQKFQLLKIELDKTLTKMRAENGQLSAEVQTLDNQLGAIQSSLIRDFQPKAKLTKEELDILLARRSEIENDLSIFADLQRFEDMKGAMETKAKQEEKKQIFSPVSTSATEEFAVLVGEILENWKYPDLGRVVFDVSKQDIVIGGKQRDAHGKGYRAITYSAFVIGLLLFCRRNNLPHPGFVILDSPLVTYREPDVSEADKISESMVPAFYNYLSNLPHDCQVIVIENEEPPEDVRAKASYTHFTHNSATGRYGFLLPPIANV